LLLQYTVFLTGDSMMEKFPPLDTLTIDVLHTEQAAYYLSLSPQTLRVWACKKTGPLTPIKIGHLLYWRVSDIKNLFTPLN